MPLSKSTVEESGLHKRTQIGSGLKSGDTFINFSNRQRAFPDFVLQHYVKEGVEELDTEKLIPLLRLRYKNSIRDAQKDLGNPIEMNEVFTGFQRYLYQQAS